MIAQVAASRLEHCNSLRENGFLFVHLSPSQDQSAVSRRSPLSLSLSLSQMAPSEAAAEPAQWLEAVEAVLPWRMA